MASTFTDISRLPLEKLANITTESSAIANQMQLPIRGAVIGMYFQCNTLFFLFTINFIQGAAASLLSPESLQDIYSAWKCGFNQFVGCILGKLTLGAASGLTFSIARTHLLAFAEEFFKMSSVSTYTIDYINVVSVSKTAMVGIIVQAIWKIVSYYYVVSLVKKKIL